MKRRRDNPLAAARGKVDTESLWHRKTGAGYALFVEYYAQQPAGVVVVTKQAVRHGAVRPAESQPVVTKKGLSRAAKRRKKKKGQAVVDVAVGVASEPSPASSSSSSNPLFALLNDDNRYLKPFLAFLEQPLPVTFRIRSGIDAKQAAQIRKRLVEFDVVRPVAWNDSIYQAKLSKAQLAEYPALKEWLIQQSQSGTVARQEIGSMLPVLALARIGAIAGGARVLDLCASPGSKTLQALEVVGRSGRIRANDIHPSRLAALQEAVTRSGVDGVAAIKYTQKDAVDYPLPQRLYDAVICDVPCSGDGTIRKDAHILPNWTPATATALHPLQLRILQRALQCVRVGGVVAYSTCSMNPIEDEAVVGAVLRDNIAYELVEWPLTAMAHRPGVSAWQVADIVESVEDERPRLRWHESYEAAIRAGMQEAKPTMWPTGATFDRCHRLWPQDGDTGGFFVAVIKRIK